jgi:hypothetical protein
MMGFSMVSLADVDGVYQNVSSYAKGIVRSCGSLRKAMDGLVASFQR